jgi:hypothetical protein
MDAIQHIAALLQSAAHDSEGKLLLYSEVEDGMISADIFSKLEGEPVRYRFSPTSLKEAIYSYWESEDASARWATMALVVEHGRFSIDLQYADSLEADEGLEERRPRIVRTHFGDASVDYSSPKAANTSG